MAQSLKEALLKAGFVSKEKLAPKPRRQAVPAKKKTVGFLEGKHLHHLRTECEACRKSAPDVEYYEHSKKSLAAKWLCIQCPDAENILDNFRQTVHSEQAMRRLFQRRYGPTKVFK